MTRIVVDGAMASKFQNRPGHAKVYSEVGQLLGDFSPPLNKSGQQNASSTKPEEDDARIVVDAAMASKLHIPFGPVDLCDETGRVLGYFWPPFDKSQYENLEPQISKEELQRRMEDKGRTYTTAEVLAYLEKL
ncbi:MAG TPA: hypothetical protein VEL76_08985 [Gemmataceae bacterium]|nr:hypothetical protein [Gemmataceae bacterium]